MGYRQRNNTQRNLPLLPSPRIERQSRAVDPRRAAYRVRLDDAGLVPETLRAPFTCDARAHEAGLLRLIHTDQCAARLTFERLAIKWLYGLVGFDVAHFLLPFVFTIAIDFDLIGMQAAARCQQRGRRGYDAGGGMIAARTARDRGLRDPRGL